MFADVPPPPSFCLDWYMVGWPASLIIPCALSASLITMFLVLARRGRPWRNVLIVGFCIFLFVLADYTVYEFGLKNQHLWQTKRDRPPQPIDSDNKVEPIPKPVE